MMKICKVRIKNFRSIRELYLSLRDFTVLIGKNDAGKSNILYALKLFLEDGKISEEDLFYGRGEDENFIEIEVSFSDFPNEIELEENVITSLKDENMLDSEGYLTIMKRFTLSADGKTKIEVFLKVLDYDHEDFFALWTKNEKTLNDILKRLGLTPKKSGRSITNLEKRNKIRVMARNMNIKKTERYIPIMLKSKQRSYQAIKKYLQTYLPSLVFYPCNMPIDPDSTFFQNEFKPLVDEVLNLNQDLKKELDQRIARALQERIDRIFEYYKKYSPDMQGFKAEHKLVLKKGFSFDIKGVDIQGVETSFTRRGAGSRRILMLSFLQYLADKNNQDGEGSYIIAIEEPEAFLHPGLQRELIKTFFDLCRVGYQVIVTTHSPVFAGSTDIDNLRLVIREHGETKIIENMNDILDQIVKQLGVEPRDQIITYNAIVFVEGEEDIYFFNAVAEILKNAGVIEHTFEDKNIGFIPYGGSNLKTFVERKLLKKLNKNFAVIRDSDKKSPNQNIGQKVLRYKRIVEKDGGLFILLRKREIENYIHPRAILRNPSISQKCKQFLNNVLKKLVPQKGKNFVSVRERIYDFEDIKDCCGKKVYKIIKDMTIDELKEMDKYFEKNKEKHELIEIIKELLNLC